MTWTISITGHDDLTEDEKVLYEEAVVTEARCLVDNIKGMDGGHITTAMCTTNTTGSVNLLEEQPVEA